MPLLCAGRPVCLESFHRTFLGPAPKKEPSRQFKVGDKIRVNLHRGKIDEAVVKGIIETDEGTKLQVDVVGLDVTALIDLRQVVEN
jgi:transcription antitermination factor NusG